MAREIPSRYLVLGRAVGLVGLLWPGAARWSLPRPVTAAAAAAVLAGGTTAGCAVGRLRHAAVPDPEPVPGAELRTDGPYRWSRHPLYLGALVAAAGTAVLRRRPGPLAAAALLAGVFHLAADAEERRLYRRFGARYAAYVVRTPRMLGRPRRDV